MNENLSDLVRTDHGSSKDFKHDEGTEIKMITRRQIQMRPLKQFFGRVIKTKEAFKALYVYPQAVARMANDSVSSVSSIYCDENSKPFVLAEQELSNHNDKLVTIALENTNNIVAPLEDGNDPEKSCNDEKETKASDSTEATRSTIISSKLSSSSINDDESDGSFSIGHGYISEITTLLNDQDGITSVLISVVTQLAKNGNSDDGIDLVAHLIQSLIQRQAMIHEKIQTNLQSVINQLNTARKENVQLCTKVNKLKAYINKKKRICREHRAPRQQEEDHTKPFVTPQYGSAPFGIAEVTISCATIDISELGDGEGHDFVLAKECIVRLEC